MRTLITCLLLTCCGVAMTACKSANWVDTVVWGSAEHPDPVLERAMAYQREGQLKIEAVMESYPVQIRLSAPQRIIDELKAMPRKALVQ